MLKETIPGEGRKTPPTKRRPKAGIRPDAPLTANEVSCLSGVLELLRPGKRTVAILLDGERDTIEALSSLDRRGLIRFVPPLIPGTAALIGRPKRV